MAQAALPLCAVQRQFWLAAQIDPHNTAYNVCALFRIEGALDVGALREALNGWIAAHDVLRSSYPLEAGVPRMQLAETLSVELAEEPVAAGQVAALAAEERARAFDLERGPLLRARLWKATEEPALHWLALTLHHIAVDLGSKELAGAELAARYRAASGAPALPGDEAYFAPAPQYASYLQSQLAWPGSAARAQAVDYFRGAVPTGWAPLSLPEDRTRPAVQSLQGDAVRFVVPREMHGRLEALARALQTRDFLLLMALYAVVLARYAGQDRVMLGVPFSNRRSAELRATFGCFVNTLPVPVELGEHTTLRQLLATLRRTMLGHHRHQELGTSELFEALSPPRERSRNALYQAGYTFEPPMSLPLDRLTVTSEKVHAGGAQLDVFLTHWHDRDGLAGQLEYATALFERASIEGLVESYRTLIERLCAEPALLDRPFSELDVLSPRDRQRLALWNATDRDYAPPPMLHSLFEAQAARTPARVALEFEGIELSYAELDGAANALAGALIADGVQPGQLVGLFAERSLELVIGVYGILKAGAAYVPLDPEYPAQRLAHMLEDARPSVIVTTPKLRAQAPGGAMLRVVDARARADARGLPGVDGSSTAYVIFTSGSTGRPKGAANAHAAIVNRILWMQDALRLAADDVVLHKTPFSFDVSVWELFWPLAVGARLLVAAPGVHRDPDALQRCIVDGTVTTLHFVPSMLQAFLEHPRASACPSVRRVVVSGEALSTELERRFFERLAHSELHNLYGPTEAAVDVSWWQCDRQRPRAPVPIGRPIANTQLHVLDARRRQVPVGVAGELYIGGVQVGLGYVARPELSAERFVPDPFSPRGDARLYRTGDLARHTHDGMLEYLGRIDHQIKLRGLRIELGEIETVLARHPGVRQAVVVPRPAGAGDLQLVAYVAAEGSAEPADALQAALRSHAAAELPEYMVPARFVRLDSLPLTPSGKVDRARLPDVAPTAPGQAHAEPRGTAEQRLADLWRELLGVERVSVDASFFELGGTSLLCARMIVPLRQWYSERVPLVALFEHVSVRALAEYLEHNYSGVQEGAAAQPAPGVDRALDQAVERANRRRQALNRKR